MNNLVKISEAYTNTSVAFKPSEFKFAEIGPKTGFTTAPSDPHVIIWLDDVVSTSALGTVATPLYLGGLGGMTATQAQEVLETVYTAVDDYYTSLLS